MYETCVVACIMNAIHNLVLMNTVRPREERYGGLVYHQLLCTEREYMIYGACTSTATDRVDCLDTRAVTSDG